MNRDYFSVPAAEPYSAPGKKQLIPKIDNEKEIPCDFCEYETRCALQNLDCVASRNWYSSGNYNEKDVNRLVRTFRKR